MSDVHEPEIRSYNMSRIRGKDTKPELVVRRLLHAKGYRFRLHGKYKNKKLPGKPDIVLPKFSTLIFVHGCFWHGHVGCRFFRLPKTNRDWWSSKITTNKERDNRNINKLKEENWQVIIIWECEIRDQPETTFVKVLNSLWRKYQ